MHSTRWNNSLPLCLVLCLIMSKQWVLFNLCINYNS